MTIQITRRSFIQNATAGVAGSLSGSLLAGARTIPMRPFRLSLSVSPFTEMVLANGITFTDGVHTARTSEELQLLFMAHGATEVYARIGTRRKFTPGNGDHGLERGLERARLAKKLEIAFNPEIGLFPSYGDFTSQPGPDFSDFPQLKPVGEWHTLTVQQMCHPIRDYCALIANEIADTGARVNYWDLGNEIDFGVAGISAMPATADATYRAPDKIDPEIGKMSFAVLVQMPEPARINWLSAHLWPHTAQLLSAAVEGIKSVDPNARFSTHISGVGPYWPKVALAFFKVHAEHGYLPDQLGTSFYPTSDARQTNPFGRLKETVSLLSRELKRPVFIAEYAFPAASSGYAGGNWSKPIPGYAVSPQGQADFTHDLVKWGMQTGLLSGIRPWAPDFVGPAWGGMALFDLKDKTAISRPVIDAFRKAAADAAPGGVT